MYYHIQYCVTLGRQSNLDGVQHHIFENYIVDAYNDTEQERLTRLVTGDITLSSSEAGIFLDVETFEEFHGINDDNREAYPAPYFIQSSEPFPDFLRDWCKQFWNTMWYTILLIMALQKISFAHAAYMVEKISGLTVVQMIGGANVGKSSALITGLKFAGIRSIKTTKNKCGDYTTAGLRACSSSLAGALKLYVNFN